MLSLVQLLANHNAKYKLVASESDLFVTYDFLDEEGNHKCCSRLKYVNDAIAEGKNIKIISFDELLKTLNVSAEELSMMPFRDLSSSYNQFKPRQKQKKKEPKFENEELKDLTLGNLFPGLFEKLRYELDDNK